MVTPGTIARQLALKEVFRSLPRPKVLVDAGCGDGYYLRHIEADRKIGLDLIPPKGHHDIESIECDVRYIGISSGTCDCVMCLDVIEHVEQDIECVSEFYRILRSDGIMVLITPNDSEYMPYKTLKVMLGLDTAKMHRLWEHVKPGYSKEELITLVERCGFEVISHSTIFQPLVRVLDQIYAYPTIMSGYLWSPAQRKRQARQGGRITTILMKCHDSIIPLIFAPIVKRIERTKDNGFFHLLICKKSMLGEHI